MGLNINLCSVDAHLGWFILETRSAAGHATIITDRGGGAAVRGSRCEASAATAVWRGRQVAGSCGALLCFCWTSPVHDGLFHTDRVVSAYRVVSHNYWVTQQPPYTRKRSYTRLLVTQQLGLKCGRCLSVTNTSCLTQTIDDSHTEFVYQVVKEHLRTFVAIFYSHLQNNLLAKQLSDTTWNHSSLPLYQSNIIQLIINLILRKTIKISQLFTSPYAEVVLKQFLETN